ncbi:MAG: hypothetical protein ACKVKS_02095 [Candidatus Poseidoniales archaeon]|jgi:predicted PurR-regulated permease PerM|tara:strand:- start:1578 stop:1826 length:249 start_codon:yes stop_codon:yes gene_type:complete
MDFAIYSISLIVSYAFTRYVTERTSIHIRMKGFWIHHWIIATLFMILLFGLGIQHAWAWGILTGIALEGLPRKNWSIRDKEL